MNVTEARQILRNDEVGIIGWGMAALILAEAADEETEMPADGFEDFLLCLTRGELASGTGAVMLHRKTGRPIVEKKSHRDPVEWRQFLTENGFIPR